MPTLSPLANRSPAHPGHPWTDELMQAFGSPPSDEGAPWLLTAQAAARQALQSAGLPKRHEEAWRFTDPALLTQIPPRPIDPGALGFPDPSHPPGPPWRLSLEALLQDPEASWPEGLEVLKGDQLNGQLGQALSATQAGLQWSVHLNGALAQRVVAFRIPPGVKTSIELVSDTAERAGVLPIRLMVVVGEGAGLELIQVHRASGPSLTSVVVEALLERTATLKHSFVANGAATSALLAVTAVIQAPGSHYAHSSVCTGWGLARQEPAIVQREGQATTQLRGLHWVRERQLADTHSRVRFGGPEGTLDQVHKVVAEGHGRSVFNGCIQVPRQAQRTNASQLSRSLLLSEQARIDTKPELEIVADDVRCTHGATISRLQDDELFYLQSRGIGAAQASTLLLRSFCEEVMAELSEPARVWNPLSPLLEEGAAP